MEFFNCHVKHSRNVLNVLLKYEMGFRKRYLVVIHYLENGLNRGPCGTWIYT